MSKLLRDLNGIVFNPITFRVEIKDRSSISIQELYNNARTWEEDFDAMQYPHVFDGQGKLPLPDGTITDITATLNDKWRIFATTKKKKSTLIIFGGNLRRHDNSNPVELNPKVNVIIEQATTLSRKNQVRSNKLGVIFGALLIFLPIILGTFQTPLMWLIGTVIAVNGGYFLPINRRHLPL